MLQGQNNCTPNKKGRAITCPFLLGLNKEAPGFMV